MPLCLLKKEFLTSKIQSICDKEWMPLIFNWRIFSTWRLGYLQAPLSLVILPQEERIRKPRLRTLQEPQKPALKFSNITRVQYSNRAFFVQEYQVQPTATKELMRLSQKSSVKIRVYPVYKISRSLLRLSNQIIHGCSDFFVDHVQNNFGSVVTTPAMTVANTIPGIELPDLQVADGEDFRLWEAIRCSAAAPVFLPAHVIHALNSEFSATCVDGALIANNPDMFALTYVNSVWNVSTDEIAILSLGQGIVVRNYAEGGGLDRGLTEWASDLLSIILDGDTETQDVLMDMLYYQVLGLPAPQYLRIQLRQTEVDGELPGIDEFEAIPDLLELGKQLAELYDDYLDQFVAKYLLGTEDVIY
eukprot:TRINITY_DN3656_c0_g1_i6.p1 TRINITY_DN3656_c0_g1~~TRINITY_DN3656_c0_g1_i6.p1  ORF type:complete len:360 (+),score=28.98 TRINITY_DN3656_c0_g1_i6:311-1390(+)